MERQRVKNHKSAAAVFMMLAVVLFCSWIPVTTQAASALEKQYAAVYNYNYYRTHNTDLQKAFGTNEQKYVEHFVNYGMKEGRQGSEEFNVEIYKYNYSDLCSAYGNDNAKYYKHYVNYGKAEGRNGKTKLSTGSSTVYNGVDYKDVYNYDYYRTKNADLQKVFGTDYAKYLKHFVEYGMKEGRPASKDFILEIYKSNNADLCKAYGNNNVAYYKHYINYGKAEGRNAKTREKSSSAPSTVYKGVNYGAVYQYDYYRNHNTDLQKVFGTNTAKYLEHFVEHGMDEGRQGSEEFNLEIYKNNNADLCKAYGSKNKSYYMHYINYGKAEGRNAKTLVVQVASTVYKGVDYASIYQYEFYRNHNTDLQKAFGTNTAKYLEHFVEHGMDEGRQGSEEFNLSVYKKNYSDLVKVYGNKNNSYYLHYMNYGKNEGRDGKTLYVITVTFNANGSTFVKNGSATLQKEISKSELYIFPGSADMNAKNGYSFAGWYTNSSCTGNVVKEADIVWGKNVTLYAKWSKANTVTFNANGGYFGTDTKKTTEQFTGALLSVTPTPKHTDSHKAFVGWYYDAAGNKPAGTLNSYSVTSNVIFYAKWETGYSVTLNANGGYFESNGAQTEKFAVKKGAVVTGAMEPKNSNASKKFGGWYLDASCTKAAGNLGTYTVKSDITFYAKWVSNTCAITFDANGGYFEWSNAGQNVEYWVKGSKGRNTVTPLHRNLYKVFDGWYYDRNTTSAVGSLLNYTVTGNVTFYAKWADGYVATFNANGGYFADSGKATVQYSVKKNTAIAGVMDPLCSGKTFAGWYLDAACKQSAGDIASYTISKDVTFYAKWTAAPKTVASFAGETAVFVQAPAEIVETEALPEETTIEPETETEALPSETETIGQPEETTDEPETETEVLPSETETTAQPETEAESEETQPETEPEITETQTEAEITETQTEPVTIEE